MTRYHIAKNGKPAVCKAASDETCPLGGQHFANKDAADYYVELVTPQQSEAQIAAVAPKPFNSLDALTDAEVARRLVLTTESAVDSDWDGARRQQEILEKMKVAGYKSPDVTWNHDYLNGSWADRPSSYITPSGYLERVRHLKSPTPRTNAPAADASFGPYFRENFADDLNGAVTELDKMAKAGSWGGVAPERRIKDKAAAVRQFRDQWGPRFAQVESREELQAVLSELQASRTRLDDSKWQESGWNQGIDLAKGYAEALLRTRTAA